VFVIVRDCNVLTFKSVVTLQQNTSSGDVTLTDVPSVNITHYYSITYTNKNKHCNKKLSLKNPTNNV